MFRDRNMFKQPTTHQEKKAVKFACRLLTDFGFNRVISVPSRELAKFLTSKGYPVSYLTVITYWKLLEQMGYVTREMECRQWGVTYRLKRYAFKKILNEL